MDKNNITSVKNSCGCLFADTTVLTDVSIGTPYDRDSNGRQYCSHYDAYYYPRERQGCLSYED